MPIDDDQKRLAIRTEDHPLDYLSYEGVIPKGAYGAGRMWIIDTGTIEWIRRKESHYIFELNGLYIVQSFNLKRIEEESQWLIEKETKGNGLQEQNPKNQCWLFRIKTYQQVEFSFMR